MKKAKQDWARHVAAIKAQGISTIAYAQQHALARSTLYRWQKELQLVATEIPKPDKPMPPAQSSKFITLRMSEPQRLAPPTPAQCTLVCQAACALKCRHYPRHSGWPNWVVAHRKHADAAGLPH